MASEIRAGAAFVELFADDSKLVRGLRQASTRIKQWADKTQKQMKEFGTKVFNVGKWTFGAGAAIGTPLIAAASKFAAEGDKFDKMASRTGMATEALSELGYAAELSGSNIETLEASIHKMQTLMADAGSGSAAAKEKLRSLGLTYRDLAKQSPEKQLMSLVSKLHGVRNDGQRAALTMKIFGESANKLMPLIDAGADAIEDMRAEARELGVSMSGEDARAAAEYTDALTRLYKLFQGITQQIGAALAPELTRLVNWFVKGVAPITEWISKNRELIVTIAKWAAIIAGVGAGLMAAGSVIVGLGIVIGALGTIIAGVFAAVATILAGAAAAIGFLVTPIGLAVAAFVGFGAYFLKTSGKIGEAIDWMKGRFSSLFSTATRAWQGISDALAAGRLDLAFKVAWTAIKLVWTEGVNFLHEKWLWLSGTLQTAWATTVYWISDKFVKAWYGIQETWTEAIYTMKTLWTGFSKGVIDAWKTAERYVAKGIAWIMAQIEGVDAAEMMRVVDENYDNEQRERDDRQTEYLNKIGGDRQKNLDRIDAEKSGTLDALKDDYERKQQKRQSDYDKKLHELEQKRLDAEQEFNDAVKQAADVRAQFEEDTKLKELAKKAQEETRTIAGREMKLASTGTFNAAATQSLQSQGPMDRIAIATEETAKNTKKMSKAENTAAYSK